MTRISPMTRTTRPRLGLSLLALLCAMSSTAVAEEASKVMSVRTAMAQPAFEFTKEGKPAKLEFNFGADDFTAWARRDGSWNAEGIVHHEGLQCGTYTLSLRLGQGEPGCINVKWFREPRAVAKTTLCNNADGTLAGGNTEFQDAARFDEITCAERSVSCTGTCK